jgi:hypothetical protein
MKADIWTSNTDQKLQLLEQILVLFNPSLELQTTENYIDWTSLSTMYLSTTNFTSRTVPAGADSDIDILTLEFEMPIWISPPAKVKKLGIVQSVIANVFTESGAVISLDQLIYSQAVPQATVTTNNYTVLLFKSNTGNLTDNQYDLTIVNPTAAVIEMGLEKQFQNGTALLWDAVLQVQGGYMPGSDIWFKNSGSEIRGTLVINPLNPTMLLITLDSDTYPANTDIPGSTEIRGTIDAIIGPYTYNPLEVHGSLNGIPVGIRFLMLDDINNSAADPYDGPDGWKDRSGADPIVSANSIIEWTGDAWSTVWDTATGVSGTVVQNIRTGIKYRWDGTQWLKAFEGEYAPGDWNFKLI